MNIFRLRDFISVLVYRAARGVFGSFGRRVRVVWPLRLVGVRYFHLADDVTIANAAYIAALPEFGIEPRLTIEPGARIGEFAHIVCTTEVTIGRQALLANRVFISDCSHAFKDVASPVLGQGLEAGKPVTIGAGSWIGENACIMSARVGEHCVVGANSVVIEDVPDRCVVAGMPARIIRRYSHDHGQWLPTNADGSFRAFGVAEGVTASTENERNG
jgi:acetyltransferase-like isoleucine patch superfamily enzyme